MTTTARLLALKSHIHRLGWRPEVASLRRLLLLWLPTLGVVAAILLVPTYLILRASESEQSILALLLRARTGAILARTVGLAAAVTTASAALSLVLAWLTTRTNLPLRRLWAPLLALPLVVPSYVGAYLLVAAFGPRGLLQRALDPLGVERLPDIYGFPGAFLSITLLSYPYLYLTLRAAWQGMDPALEESARSLGHGPWQVFWRVSLPQLRPALGAGGLLVALYTFRDFGAVSIMRYNTFTRALYVQYQSAFDRSAAAALALLLIALSATVLALELRTRGRGRYYRNDPGGRRPGALVNLGRWRWAALALCLLVLTLALALPGGVLLYWLVRGWAGGFAWDSLAQATWHSLLASGLAAALTVLVAIPVAFLVTRRPGPLTGLVDRLVYIGFALPGVVVALALVFFGTRGAPWLYQTLPMLILAYLILFIPQATGTLRASLLQIHPSLEEAARSLGKSPLATFWHVLFPLAHPGVLAAFGLVFLTAMKELPATLILSPLGYNTLATEVWSAVSEAFFARAAAPALLLILVSSIPLAAITLRNPEVNL